MPDHIHLLTLGSNANDVRWKLSVELRAWTQRFHRGQRIWAPIPEPNPIPNLQHLKRQIRYVHLNPCRDGLVTDPMKWEWSTHRDVIGCTQTRWPDTDALKRCFGADPDGDAIHRYVSSDPSVDIDGSPNIDRRNRSALVADPGRALRAAAIAMRENFDFQNRGVRQLAIQVALRLNQRRNPEAYGASQTTWTRISNLPANEPGIQAVLNILSDPRMGK